MHKLLALVMFFGSCHFALATEGANASSHTATSLRCSAYYMEPGRAGEWILLQPSNYYPNDNGVPIHDRGYWSIAMDFGNIMRAHLHNQEDYERVGRLVPKLIELKSNPLYSRTHPIFDTSVNVWYQNGIISHIQVAIGLVKDKKKYRRMSIEKRVSSFRGSGQCHKWLVTTTAKALKDNQFRLEIPNGDESDGVLDAKLECILE
ncbi:MAG: hypothetical protein KGI60_00900 [Patescibacteria group bacterium]|nr:hypothetical protein [Patescibacteria group bacterium]